MSIVAITLGAIAPATAAPSRSETQAEFNRIQSQVEKIDSQLEIVVEQYNDSAIELNKTQRELKLVAAKLNAAQKIMSDKQALINKRFEHAYRQGSLQFIEVLLDTRSIEQFVYYLELLERQSEQDAKVIEQYKDLKEEISKQNAVLLKKEKEQKALLAQIKAKRDKIALQLKERNALLAKVRGELARHARLEAQRQAKLKKSIKQRYGLVARATTVSSRSTVVSRGENRGVVSIAMSEMGKPYSWGAEGPNSFDCSGFTKYVYGKLGVSLPHSSRAQYGSGQRVSMNELKSGDLVFFARGGTISHVGIYVGGGNFIHAPRTGDVVKISSINEHGGYVGAVRP